jgi:hypothetical protein
MCFGDRLAEESAESGAVGVVLSVEMCVLMWPFCLPTKIFH